MLRRPLALFILVYLLPAPGMARPQPFREGQFSLGLAGGGGPGGFGIGLDVGYLVFDGVELSMGGSYWVLDDTNLVRVTPAIKYIVTELDSFMPYIGGFARRWFFSNNAYDDLTSLGARGGVYLRARSAMLGVGVAYEKLLDCQVQLKDECTSIYPEFSLAVLF